MSSSPSFPSQPSEEGELSSEGVFAGGKPATPPSTSARSLAYARELSPLKLTGVGTVSGVGGKGDIGGIGVGVVRGRGTGGKGGTGEGVSKLDFSTSSDVFSPLFVFSSSLSSDFGVFPHFSPSKPSFFGVFLTTNGLRSVLSSLFASNTPAARRKERTRKPWRSKSRNARAEAERPRGKTAATLSGVRSVSRPPFATERTAAAAKSSAPCFTPAAVRSSAAFVVSAKKSKSFAIVSEVSS